LNVGVDIGSRGVGDASGVGVALALGLGDAATEAEGDGDGDGCWAITPTAQTTNSESRNSRPEHADLIIRRGVLFLDGVKAV